MSAATSELRRELMAFKDTKAGVKGLVDAGVTKIPSIFYSQSQIEREASNDHEEISIPTIDLQDIAHADPALRAELSQKVRYACETWGFFQVVNHEIPVDVLDRITNGIREFHEQDSEHKKRFYMWLGTKVFYQSNYNLYQSSSADWRDTFGCFVALDPPKPEEQPSICRDIVNEYSKHVMDLGFILFELLSEALGLNRNQLKDMNCVEGLLLFGHY